MITFAAFRSVVLAFLHIVAIVARLIYLVLYALGHIVDANYLILLNLVRIRGTLGDTDVVELL